MITTETLLQSPELKIVPDKRSRMWPRLAGYILTYYRDDVIKSIPLDFNISLIKSIIIRCQISLHTEHLEFEIDNHDGSARYFILMVYHLLLEFSSLLNSSPQLSMVARYYDLSKLIVDIRFFENLLDLDERFEILKFMQNEGYESPFPSNPNAVLRAAFCIDYP